MTPVFYSKLPSLPNNHQKPKRPLHDIQYTVYILLNNQVKILPMQINRFYYLMPSTQIPSSYLVCKLKYRSIQKLPKKNTNNHIAEQILKHCI